MSANPTFYPSAIRVPEFDEYRRKVARLAESRAGDAVYNGSMEHAIIVIEALFRYAKRKVRILTGSLNPLVYGPMEVIVAAHGFLGERGRTVEIVMEDEPIPGNPFISTLGSSPNLEIRSQTGAGTIVYGCHFVLADDDCYRYEEDKSKMSAVAAFGDADGGRILGRAFTDVWRSSEPAKLE